MTSEFDDIREEDLEVIPPDVDEQAKHSRRRPSAKIEKLSRELEQKTKEAAECE